MQICLKTVYTSIAGRDRFIEIFAFKVFRSCQQAACQKGYFPSIGKWKLSIFTLTVFVEQNVGRNKNETNWKLFF